MYIFNVYDHINLTNTLVDELKARGVKYKLPKKMKALPANNAQLSNLVFNTALKEITKVNVAIKNGQALVDIPKFIVEACSFIEENSYIEGIFRKGGSASKQRELKQLVNSGKPLDKSCHVVDVCNLVKLFFRELPEPLLPFYCHDMLLSCMLLNGENEQKETLLLSCLLLQLDHIALLSFFLEFLSRIASKASMNKMDVKNLATVLAPSLMPLDPKIKLRRDFNFKYHISVIEMLIINAMEVGIVPTHLAEQAMAQRRKKRRSASITRMFTGIRKIVGRAPSTPDEALTSPLDTVQRKRKSSELMPPAVTVKRRREVADTTPRLCRMGGYSDASLPRPKSACSHRDESLCAIAADDVTEENINPTVLGPAYRTINRRKQQGLKASKSTGNLLSSKRKSLERRLSNMTWRRRRNSKTDVTSSTDELSKGVEELVTIPRREYEEMKSRVSCMAKLLDERHKEEGERLIEESETLAKELDDALRICYEGNRPEPTEENISTPAGSVQVAYERAVEQSEKFEPQFAKDMRLRWSTEHRVVRSPSQRKIGSIRRRSRELTRSNSLDARTNPRNNSLDARTNLQRGRPNTRNTGLPSPRDLSGSQRPTSKQNSPRQWRPAEVVLACERLKHLRNTPDRRKSIVNLRVNNVGMVQAKAKFFNSLNHSSTDGEGDRSNESMETSVPKGVRPGTVMKENRQPVIKAALPSAHILKTPRSLIRSSARSRATPLKVLPDNITTPFRSVRRSPRILARSLSQHNV